MDRFARIFLYKQFSVTTNSGNINDCLANISWFIICETNKREEHKYLHVDYAIIVMSIRSLDCNYGLKIHFKNSICFFNFVEKSDKAYLVLVVGKQQNVEKS